MNVKDVINIKNRTKSTVGYLPYIEIGDIDTINKTYSLKEKGAVSGSVIANKGELLISTVRPTRGAICFVQEQEAAVSNAFAILNINEKICLKEFLFYQLCNPLFFEYLGKNSTGATYPTCSKDYIYNYDIYVPSLDKQQNIVNEFNKVSTILTNNKKKIDLFDEFVKARFVEMFENKNYIEKRIDEVCVLKSGTTFEKDKELDNGDMLYCKVSDMNLPENEKYMKTSKTYVSYEVGDKASIPAYSVIFPKRGGAIGTNKKRILIENTCVDLNTMGVTPKEDINIQYLYQFFQNIDLLSLSDGSAIPQLNNKNIGPLKIKIPPMSEQRKFEKFVEQIDKSKFIIQKQLDETQKLFDKLMQDYFG